MQHRQEFKLKQNTLEAKNHSFDATHAMHNEIMRWWRIGVIMLEEEVCTECCFSDLVLMSLGFCAVTEKSTK